VLSCAANPDRFHGISKRRVRQSSKRNWYFCIRPKSSLVFMRQRRIVLPEHGFL
jgi:hypothetical protein